jgi:hypothetical protein
MSMKNISNKQVVEAYLECKRIKELLQIPYREEYRNCSLKPYDLLKIWTGECEKVCFKAMERAADRGFIEYGVSLRTGWVTDKGLKLLE